MSFLVGHQQEVLTTCTGLNHVFPKIHVHLEPQNVPVFGNRVIADVIKLRGGHTEVGWPLIQYDCWCLYKKREDGCVKTQTQEENTM